MPNNLELFCLSVLPGTDLFDSAKGFGLVYEEKAPYHVIETPGFSKDDITKWSELLDISAEDVGECFFMLEK